MAPTQVTVGSITFNNNSADSNGTKWWLTDVEGWDAPPVRQSVVDVSTRHFGSMAESLLAPRPLVLKGVAMTSTTNGYFNSKDKLHSVFNLIEAGASLTYAESVYTKKVTVWLAGPIRLRDRVAHFEFEVPLIAPDPLKYNNTATTGTLDMLTPASLNVTNNGNFNTYPTITLGAGSWAGATLTITNGTISGSPTITLTNMAAGDIIDFSARTITDSGGTDKYASLTLNATTWWYLAPGVNALTFTGAGGKTLAYSLRDAWL